MLTKWLGTRSPRSPECNCFFRPQLEALEDRLPPSGMNGGNDGGNVHIMNNIHNNIHITNSFNGNTNSFNGSFNGGFLLTMPQLGSLITDEIVAAVDTYLTSPAISALLPSSVVSTLKTDLGKLDTAIAGLEGSSPILSALGTAVFDMTLNALTSTQPTI
jgi:hypothetical protein